MSRRSLSDMGVVEGSANLSAIAGRLDISVATVSRALRGLKGVHPRTQARVMKVADEMGYLRKDEKPAVSRTILVLAQASGSDNVQYYLSGVSRGAIDCNGLVLTHYLPSDRCEEMLDPLRQPIPLRDGQVDGVLLICRWPDAVVADLAQKVPLVSVIHQYPGIPMDRVGIDNESGMSAIVGHLAGLGHRKIGFFGVHPRVSWSRSRYAAFFEAMVTHGLEVNLDWTISADEEYVLAEPIMDAFAYVPKVKALISAGVTALVCSGELLCYGLRDALVKEGVRVPEDLSLTGYHVPRLQPGVPELTSVSLSSEELGAAAVRRLLRRFEFPDETSRTILLPCELVIGSSTAAPRH